jgi:hypothetical protein
VRFRKPRTEPRWLPRLPGISADGFLYARCAAVLEGKQVVDDILANPRTFKRRWVCRPKTYSPSGPTPGRPSPSVSSTTRGLRSTTTKPGPIRPGAGADCSSAEGPRLRAYGIPTARLSATAFSHDGRPMRCVPHNGRLLARGIRSSPSQKMSAAATMARTAGARSVRITTAR